MNEFEEIKGMIRQLNKCDLTVPDNLMSFLGLAEGVRKYDAAMSKMIANKVKGKALELCEVDVRHYEVYNSALRYLASKHMDFDSYMLYVEKNRDAEEQYYLPRREQLKKYVAEMQRLIDDELDILSLSMPPGTGKALAMDAKVLTPRGFVRNDSLKVGDKVISGRGTLSTVLGVFPQGKKPMYDVIFDDGSTVRCSIDHLWTVQTREDRLAKNKYRTLPLSDMLPKLKVENGRRKNYSVDYVPRIEFEEKYYDIHPYVIGALIGDGSLSSGNLDITTPDDEIKENLIRFLPDGFELSAKDDITFRIKEGHSERNVLGQFTRCYLREALEKYNLWGKRSHEKHIPEEYKIGSYEQRLWLLRGLLDTDGTAEAHSVSYSTVSKQLALDVIELVHSLGGYASLSQKQGRYKKDDKYINCRICYRVTIQFSSSMEPLFTVKRKQDGYSFKRTVIKRFIEDVQYVGEEECQCIYIDDESHLYITDDYVITHNTTMGEFFMSFVMGHFPNTPNLMSSHSGFMTRMFYDAVLNIIKSNEYCWADVFPDVVFESTNAKEETINLGKWQPFKTLTCRPIRASLTGVTRCEGYLYVDDLVSGIEEALSKERLDKLYGEYTTDLKSRKKKKAKEIHIATRWSVHDVIGRLERQYEGTDRAKFIAIPDIDPETGESNFDYDYDVGFDAKYFKDMELSMDDVSYRCLYKSDPIEREGILYHPEDLKRYLGGLPIGEDGETKEPDAILAICDTKDTGTDYNFLGVFYQYGERFYLEDVVFKNIDPGTLDTLNADMLVKHKVQQAQFESNKEGSRTANKVDEIVKEKGGRCHITKKYTTQNKETKIIVNSPWVKEHVYFKDSSEYEPRSDYGVMMSFLCSYTQLGKNKFDDAPDGLAMFALFVDSLEGGKVEIMSRSELGI